MKVLLRDLGSGLYFGGGNAWVTNYHDAAGFLTLQAAGCKARGCSRDDVAVVLSYDEPKCELALNPAYCVPNVARWQGAVQAG